MLTCIVGLFVGFGLGLFVMALANVAAGERSGAVEEREA
jgi:hypothetical protein